LDANAQQVPYGQYSTTSEQKTNCNRGSGKCTCNRESVVCQSPLMPSSSVRPVNDLGERVTPCSLLEYRQSHQFQTPSCLCALLGLDTVSYTESAIFLAKSGPTTGQYVAACATGQCRYWGEFGGPPALAWPHCFENSLFGASLPSSGPPSGTLSPSR
jgi:hypothetical protein